MKPLKCDFHIHTNKDEEDIRAYTAIEYTPETIIKRAKQNNFQVLAFTHHNENFFSKKLNNYAKKNNILLIRGIEKTIEGKHILFLNVNDTLPKINLIKDLNKVPKTCAVILPHPYYPFAKSLGKISDKYMKFFDAVEYHSMYFRFFNVLNRLAVKLAKRYNKPMIGNSDAHYPIQFNSTYSLIYAEKNSASIISAIKQGKIRIVSKPLPFLRVIRYYIKGLCNRKK